MLGALYVIILAGLVGTKMPGRNLAVMVVWILWLFVVTVILVPFGGRIWCLLCPLPALSDAWQRWRGIPPGGGVRARPATGWFSAWPRLLLFLVLGTFSTALAASPRATALVLLAMVVAATVLTCRGVLRTFCLSACPINAFVGLYSMVGRLAVRPAAPGVCAGCRVSTCARGSARGWPCPYGLRLGDVDRNNDCGMCGECVRTCAYDNVALVWRPFAMDLRLADRSEAFLAIVMFVLAVTYCFVHLGPWPATRHWVDVVDRGNWAGMGVYALALWTCALVIAPAVVWLCGVWGRRLSGSRVPDTAAFLAASTGLVPLGLMVWAAFATEPLLVDASFVLGAISDPLGWNWDLLGTAGAPWHQVCPELIPWIQVGAVLTGLYYGWRNTWRRWSGEVGPATAWRAAAPAGLFMSLVTAVMVWFFAA